MSENNLYNQLAIELVELQAEVFKVEESHVSDRILKHLTDSETEHVAVNSDSLLDEIGLVDLLKKSGLKVTMPLSSTPDPVSAKAWQSDVADASVGITSAFAISAETGSALLFSGYPDLRSVSLLPEEHIIIIRESQIVADVESLFKLWIQNGITDENAVIISGPSRTADIEKELVLGVHGPCKLTVFVIRES